jgi:lathosterol oxidase
MSFLNTNSPDKSDQSVNAEWHWIPSLPVPDSPLFAWPPTPREALHWIANTWHYISERTVLVVLAAVTWVYLTPSLARAESFEAGWIAELHLRNLALMILVAGGLHLYFYTYKQQAWRRKFHPRDLNRNSRTYTWRNQV